MNWSAIWREIRLARRAILLALVGYVGLGAILLSATGGVIAVVGIPAFVVMFFVGMGIALHD